VNLRDWEPNRSVLSDPRHGAQVEALLQESDRLEEAGELEAALAKQIEILELEPCFAWSCKRAGDLQARRGAFDEAQHFYQRAVDCDGNPYREMSSQNEILQRLCAARGVPLVDAVGRFAAAAENGLPGYDLFWDNCHPRLKGYALLGQGFARALCTLLECSVPAALPPMDRLEEALHIDRTFRRQILHERGRYCYGAATLIFAPEERLQRARFYLESAAAMGEVDADLLSSMAVLEALEGDVDASLASWRRAAELDADVAHRRAHNPYVVQIMKRHGVENVFFPSH
jgi:tetratricopeptide (TPR) repeat protein